MPKEICSHEGCPKKLTITTTTCKCERKFCGAHKCPETHACTFDFKAERRRDLLRLMSTPVTAKKVEAI
jgi:hypothetical protein